MEEIVMDVTYTITRKRTLFFISRSSPAGFCSLGTDWYEEWHQSETGLPGHANSIPEGRKLIEIWGEK